MEVILNISLEGVYSVVTPAAATRALRVLRQHGFGIRHSAVHASDTELTLVASVTHDGGGIHGDIRRTAAALNQERIACWKPSRMRGKMLGATIDLDDSWGDFNPEFFIMPDGTRLSQSGLQAA